jgi:hypothetical protein
MGPRDPEVPLSQGANPRVDEGVLETNACTHRAERRTTAGVWTILDDHLYIDDAVSGADVKNLRARARLIDDVKKDSSTS